MDVNKRVFDIVVCSLAAVLWLPVLFLCSLLVLLCCGRPIFYVSKRRIYLHKTRRIVKFRTMVRNAEKIANRQTIPVADQRFLNIDFDSPLYTRLGRIFEKVCITELPQLVHVLTGKMTLVGNRPLPESVIESIKEEYPYMERRFSSRCGMTGPVQLIGRDNIPDHIRLHLEISYSRICREAYSARLDFMLLLYTVLIGLRLVRSFQPREVESMMRRYANRDKVAHGALTVNGFGQRAELPSNMVAAVTRLNYDAVASRGQASVAAAM
ncbi:MAG: sugar transferase [Sedimentisphaerales bacterium]|nr:sugar transferase [Sedimentisphaerales bacterium]